MRRQLVVARHNEDIKWVKDLPNDYEVVVYAKHPVLYKIQRQVIIFPMPFDDFGREASTYLSHIISNYSNLADYTYFVQGRIDDHSLDLPADINFMGKFKWLSSGNATSKHDSNWSGMTNEKTYGYVYSQLFEKTPPEVFDFGISGMFVASKEAIQQRPVNFYDRVLKYFKENFPNDTWAFYMERFWKTLIIGEHHE